MNRNNKKQNGRSGMVYAFLFFCLATGCTAEQESGIPGSGREEVVPVPLEIGAATIESAVETVTRATPTATPLTRGSIGVFLTGKEATTTYAPVDNCQYNYNTSTKKWEAQTSTETIYLGGEDAYVCAYYPYSPASGYINETALPLTTQDFAENKDLYYAKNVIANGTTTKREITLPMSHAYALICLNIIRENYPTACVISAISIENSSLATGGTINITNGTITTSTFGNHSLNSPFTTLGATDTYARNVLAVPCTLAQVAGTSNSLVIKLTVDDQSLSAAIPSSDLSELKQGEKYVIGLKIKGTGIEPSVSVESWTDEKVNSGTEYEPKPKS